MKNSVALASSLALKSLAGETPALLFTEETNE